ncbi:hypothetical protein OsJ_32394 [Oryza sativa Japonica Group]|uniref:Hydrophobic seed protein domain-containing protein n=1 Tax=Oryza sativa subsp. japonica TaxID=39947 RepID=A3C749_ORYSJ|nr:hypothetical protein OsJ_32394 [Oryza sativa Japonica Group]
MAATAATGHGRCPIDALKLRVCANVLNGALGVNVGHGPYDCCPLLAGLADADAAVCLCTAVEGQRARRQPQRPRRAQAHPQQVRQDLPLRLHLLIN